jgi:hypothetical protein
MTISLLVQQLLAPHAVRLGRLVFDISAPWQDYCPHVPIKLKLEDDISTAPFQHVREIMECTRSTKFHANLTRAISALTGANHHTYASVTAPQGVTYSLLNSGNHFEQICQDVNVRAWFERAIKRGFDVYMVVGIITLTDAKIVNTIDTTTGTQGTIEVPVANALMSGASSVVQTPISDLLESSIGGGRLTQNAANIGYVAPGDRIIAVQYRKVRYEWAKRRSVETAFLQRGNRWIVHGPGNRSDVTGEDDDVVDVDLAETTSKEDLDIEYETYIVGSEGFIVVDQAIPKEFVSESLFS